ncbi:MAG: GlyGly-CTERM sorting domain-containing protein [Thiotrichaceae bacterium]
MKNKPIIPTLSLSALLLSGITWAATGTQTITATLNNLSVSPGDSVQLTVSYPAGNPETTGLGVTLYFDSSKLEFVETSNVLNTPSMHKIQAPVDDADNTDADASTDKKIVAAFANFSADPFIASSNMSADLFTVSFLAKDGFSSDTVINFTGNPAVGYSFASTSAKVAYKDSTATVADDTSTSSASSSGGGGAVSWFMMPFLLLLGLVRKRIVNKQ